MHNLDFTLVTTLPAPTIFVRLPQSTEESLAQLPETLSRARAAVRFAYWAESSAEFLHVPEDQEIPMREAYLRASLGEYVSMEETAKRDFALLGVRQTSPMMSDSQNPLLHAFRELRNLNFHLASSRIAEESKPAVWHFDGKDQPFDYSLTLVEGFTVGQFMSLRNAKYYHPEDVQSLVEWFNNEQREWGAPHLLVLAISHYANDLLARLPRAA